MQQTAFRDNSPPRENPRRLISRKPTFNIIEQINNLLDFESESGIYTLTDEQIVRVEEAKDEYKNSSIISEKVANQEIEKWLNEK